MKGNFSKLIIAPCISEKSTRLQAEGQYIFKVRSSATKFEIARAMKELFDVEVVAVNLLRMKGKKRNFRNIAGKRSDWKKAYITLKEGQVINLGGV